MIKDWQYKQYVRELKSVPLIPKGWGGRKQNDIDDSIVKDLLFRTYKYNDLISKLEKLNLLDSKDYYIKRWMMILLEKCDRYLFSQYDCVEDNPNYKDQEYDFKINNTKLDLKSTRISKELLEKYTDKKFYELDDEEYKNAMMHFINSPDEMIHFLYENQSTGVRYSLHNRLFLITADLTSKNNYNDEFDLRLDFDNKDKLINDFITSFNEDSLNTYEFYNLKTKRFERVKAKAIFLYKTNEGLFYSLGKQLAYSI